MFQNVLMPADRFEHSARVIERDIELAELCAAMITGIHVVPGYLSGFLQGFVIAARIRDWCRDRATVHVFEIQDVSWLALHCCRLRATNFRLEIVHDSSTVF